MYRRFYSLIYHFWSGWIWYLQVGTSQRDGAAEIRDFLEFVPDFLDHFLLYRFFPWFFSPFFDFLLDFLDFSISILFFFLDFLLGFLDYFLPSWSSGFSSFLILSLIFTLIFILIFLLIPSFLILLIFLFSFLLSFLTISIFFFNLLEAILQNFNLSVTNHLESLTDPTFSFSFPKDLCPELQEHRSVEPQWLHQDHGRVSKTSLGAKKRPGWEVWEVFHGIVWVGRTL